MMYIIMWIDVRLLGEIWIWNFDISLRW